METIAEAGPDSEGGTLATTITLSHRIIQLQLLVGLESRTTYQTAVMAHSFENEPVTKAGKIRNQYSPCATVPGEIMRRSKATAVPERPTMRR